MRAVVLILSLALASVSFAKKIRLQSPAEREQYIRDADVWLAPSWISPTFQFGPVDVLRGPTPVGEDKYFESENVFCRQTAEQAVKVTKGKTSKFYCDLNAYDHTTKSYVPVMKKNGEPRELKIKFKEEAREFPSEVIASRFLWALGFPSDRMFFVTNVFCWGCTADPFEQRGLDPASAVNPRRFSPVGIETKFDGESIEITKANVKQPEFINAKETKIREGWAYRELKEVSRTDTARARQQKIHREALLLLSIFIQHSDNKRENQRLVCTGKVSDDGKCLGKTVMLLQDVGATFGQGRRNTIDMSKLDYKAWAAKPVWFDAVQCRGNFGFNFDMHHIQFPHISEDARQFFLGLLRGFSAGPEGRKRVQDLFLSGHAERHGHTINEWTNAFMSKVEQIAYPLGRDNPDFKCPRRIR